MMNLQQTLDQSAAWHLKQLQMLCPEGTKATIVLRIPGENSVMVLGDEPDTKAALWEAIRCINGTKSDASQHHGGSAARADDTRYHAEGIVPNAAVPIGTPEVLETPPTNVDDFLGLNGGGAYVIGDMRQG